MVLLSCQATSIALPFGLITCHSIELLNLKRGRPSELGIFSFAMASSIEINKLSTFSVELFALKSIEILDSLSSIASIDVAAFAL
jgi:hypothetical protein